MEHRARIFMHRAIFRKFSEFPPYTSIHDRVCHGIVLQVYDDSKAGCKTTHSL